MATVSVNLTGYGENANGIEWAPSPRPSLGTVFSDTGDELLLNRASLFNAGVNAGLVIIDLVPNIYEFTADFEDSGRIIFIASDGELLEVMIANADMDEPYQWMPSNASEVIAFAQHVRGLTDKATTLTLTQGPQNMKFNGVDFTAAKHNGVDFTAAKYNGVAIF